MHDSPHPSDGMPCYTAQVNALLVSLPTLLESLELTSMGQIEARTALVTCTMSAPVDAPRQGSG